MRPWYLAPALAAGLLCLTGCEYADFGDFERFSRDFHYSYPLHANGKLSVETFNGSVEISTWDSDTVDISGTKYGPTQEAADNLKITIDNSPDAVSVRVPRPIERRNHQGAKFVVKIPKSAIPDRITSSNGAIRISGGVGPARLHTSNGQIVATAFHGQLDAQTSNGSIELIDVDGDVVAHSSNGRIRAERLQGALQASTSNSSVHAEILHVERPVHVETSNGPVELFLPPDFNRDLRVNTNNGSITVRLPAAINAHILARTSNSSITTDFDVRMQGEMNRNHLDATIGAGGPLLDLSTSNGSIRLLKM